LSVDQVAVSVDSQRRIDRIHTSILGLVVGVVWRVADGVLKICERIARSDIVPFYAEGALSLVFLPMVFGAIAAVIFHSRRRNLRKGCSGLSGWGVLLEGMLFGAVGTVVWWVVPVALFLLTTPLLFVASTMCTIVVGAIAGQFYGTFANTPSFLFDLGSYSGGVIVGGVIGWGLGGFVTGIVRELGGKRPWENRKHVMIGRTLGAALGAAYGAVFVWVYVVNEPLLRE
jgi:hypothetical protein